MHKTKMKAKPWLNQITHLPFEAFVLFCGLISFSLSVKSAQSAGSYSSSSPIARRILMLESPGDEFEFGEG
jgi:hypothetical protein